MSATIYYEPVSKIRRSFGTMAPSSFWDKLSQAVGTHDDVITLDESHLIVLRALAIGARESHPEFADLVEALKKYDSIRVWRQF